MRKTTLNHLCKCGQPSVTPHRDQIRAGCARCLRLEAQPDLVRRNGGHRRHEKAIPKAGLNRIIRACDKWLAERGLVTVNSTFNTKA